jgi:hypothetical protein
MKADAVALIDAHAKLPPAVPLRRVLVMNSVNC